MLNVKAISTSMLRPGLMGIKAFEKSAPNAELVQIIGDLSALLAGVDDMSDAHKASLSISVSKCISKNLTPERS